ncbi:MAG: hypothetical protein FJX74_00255 [Armatimonadetes bacterium]|nr:hypothetical protein [Armatimonadota bacterium]
MERVSVNLVDLDRRHPGLTPSVAEAHAEAARVCLDRHHVPPVAIHVSADADPSEYRLDWEPADDQARATHANELDATRDGAYAVTFACMEHSMGLVVVGRAEHGSGADWYVAPRGLGFDEFGLPNYDDHVVMALEVSGVDTGPTGGRMREKREQLLRGAATERGVAAVVRFSRPTVELETVTVGAT